MLEKRGVVIRPASHHYPILQPESPNQHRRTAREKRERPRSQTDTLSQAFRAHFTFLSIT
jgi:hypothetical protein